MKSASGAAMGVSSLGRAVFAACFALLLGVVVAPSHAQATIVISQIYGGGGNNSLSPYTNDFIELFNNGNTSQSLVGWSLQYTSATGTGNFGANVTPLFGTLAPGQYFLVKESSGGMNGAPLPPADATGNIFMGATAGKVALVNTLTGLACNGFSTPCSAGQLASIVDLVGYGVANFFEGAGPAPGPSNTTAIIRAGGGYIDTNDNAFDFAAGLPMPRNSDSPLNVAAVPEPSTWAMMLLGFAGLGFAFRLFRSTRALRSPSV